jgi:pimeloyl-ACP methyl ester carboxylesterase
MPDRILDLLSRCIIQVLHGGRRTDCRIQRIRKGAAPVLVDGAGDVMTLEQAIVFVHGSGDNSQVWQQVIDRLPDFSCVAVDLPGHGGLRQQPGPPTMSVADYAAWVEQELARRGVHEVCVAGHSLGGAIALHMALASPSLVRSLALIGTGARLRVAPQLLEAAQTDPQAATEMLAELGFAPGHAEQAASYLQQADSAPPGILWRDLAACNDFDIMPDLARITQPAIIITGEQDRLTPPKYALFLQEHLPRASLALIPDAGHCVPIEQPGAVAEALSAWLTTLCHQQEL